MEDQTLVKGMLLENSSLSSKGSIFDEKCTVSFACKNPQSHSRIKRTTQSSSKLMPSSSEE
jgi:hypothetical protein